MQATHWQTPSMQAPISHELLSSHAPPKGTTTLQQELMHWPALQVKAAEHCWPNPTECGATQRCVFGSQGVAARHESLGAPSQDSPCANLAWQRLQQKSPVSQSALVSQ
jgi:hypothetical protein